MQVSSGWNLTTLNMTDPLPSLRQKSGYRQPHRRDPCLGTREIIPYSAYVLLLLSNRIHRLGDDIQISSDSYSFLGDIRSVVNKAFTDNIHQQKSSPISDLSNIDVNKFSLVLNFIIVSCDPLHV